MPANLSDNDAQRAAMEFASSGKTSRNGILLVPQPSDDPQDPLNWSTSKKFLTLLVVSLASFAATCQALANASSFFEQAATYEGRTVLQITYTLSASNAGLAVGPLIWAPIAKLIGASAAILWGMVLVIACNIWGALMTGRNDYIPFVLSRLFASLTGSVATTVGAGVIFDIYFLHQRGKAFAFYTVMLLLGTTAAPTLSGLIVQGSPWPVEYWYNVALEGIVVILCLCFLHETGWSRPGGETFPPLPKSFAKNRAATFFFTQRVTPKMSASKLMHFAVTPFRIGTTRIGLLAGGFVMITFGWGIAVVTLLAVYLQTPIAHGGYGFTPIQNAYFTFSSWISIAMAMIFTHLMSDRLPLWVCNRFGGGSWKPEYRLHSIWFTGLFLLPVGIGLFGATLQYHLSFIVLALAVFLIYFALVVNVPIVTTYVVECSTGYASEAATIMNFYRVIFGLAVPFFIDEWTEKVGVGWVFGMSAFFSVFAFLFVIILIFFGQAIRRKAPNGLSGEGMKIVGLREDKTAKDVS